MEYITTANVLVWLFVTLGFFLMFVSYWLAAAALFPAQVERCQRQLGRPVLTSLIGLLLGVPPMAAGFALLGKGPGLVKVLGIFLIAAPIFTALVGSAGLARRIGSGLLAPGDGQQPWHAVLRGGAVLALTFLLPLLGQLLLIPLVLASGLGAMVFGWAAGWREQRAQVLPSMDAGATVNSVPPLP